MTPRENDITRTIKSRLFALLMMIVSVAAAVGATALSHHSPAMLEPGMGLVAIPSMEGLPLLLTCLGLNAAVVVVMSLLNGQYNLLRTTSWLFLAMWTISQCGSPYMMTGSIEGLTAATGLLLCVWLAFSVYQSPDQTKRVFLLFFLLTWLVSIHWAYAVYVPVFLIGLAQMRCASVRTVLSALTGIAAPVWLLWAFSIVDFSAIELPRWRMPDIEYLRANVVMSVTAAFTLLTGIVLMAANMVKVYGYNAKTRAHNGLLVLTWLASGLLAVADLRSLWATLPILNCTTAFQTGMFFRIYTQRRAYLPVIIIIACYAALYVWTVLM